MASTVNLSRKRSENPYFVVHPLDDLPEAKRDVLALGLMPMTMSVRLSLFALRGYLFFMTILVAYHVLGMAGLLNLYRG